MLRMHAVANHGVSPELVARQFEASRRFFQLPLEAKLALRVRVPPCRTSCIFCARRIHAKHQSGLRTEPCPPALHRTHSVL